jgi:hypothetical protein
VPSGAKTLAISAVVLMIGLALAGQAAAQGTETIIPACKENEKETQPASTTNPIELQANKARPTFDVGLADKSDGDDNIFFSPKAGERIDNRVAAELLGSPRAGRHRFHGLISVAAHPSQSGRSVVVEACFEDVNHWSAGSYEGTIRVYGPQIADFSYALVVTTKWPFWVALVVIGATLVFSVLVFLFLPQVPNPVLNPQVPSESTERKELAEQKELTRRQKRRKKWKAKLKVSWRPWLGLFLGIVVAAVLAGLTYWTQYDANDTWGSDPQGQILALALAAFGATVIGYGVVGSAQKQMPVTQQPGGPGADTPTPPASGGSRGRRSAVVARDDQPKA